MEFLQRLYQQSLNIWKSLNLQQRIFVGLGFLFVLVTLLAFAGAVPRYGVLYANLYANPLSTPAETALAGADLSASQFELRSRVEKYFHQKLQSMFDHILGPGKSVVRVSVDLDFDKIETTAEKYDPDSIAVRSEQRQRESSTMPTSQAGVSANLPSAAYAGPQKQSSSSITNFEVSKTIDHIIKSPSTIKGISVAVVVDGTYKEVTGPDGAVTTEYIPRTDEDLEKYKRMVVAAIGASVARNVEVINVPLTGTAAESELAAPARGKRNLYVIAIGFVVIVALLLLFFIVRQIVKRTPPSLARKAAPTGEAVPPRVEAVAKEEADVTIGIKRMAEERPEKVASLIKVWLKEAK